MAAPSQSSQVTDRLLAHSANAAATAAGAIGTHAIDLLRAVIADRKLVVPTDLVFDVGAGTTTSWQLNAAQTLVVANTTRDATLSSTTRDAYDCGRIAATAALSAVHARAAAPLFARLTLACPADAGEAAKKSLIEGVAVAMAASGAFLADVELVEAAVLRFDVLVAGIVRPDRVRGVAGAQADDVLILAGPLGAGIYAAAHARQKLSDDDRDALIARATRSNAAGIALGSIRNVHAVAAVGPEGLIAATLALADAAGLHGRIDAAKVPALPRALLFAKTGSIAPLSSRNWNRDGARVALADAVMPEMRSLLTDPQASGALLIACKPESVDRVLKLCGGDDAVAQAAAIGRFVAPVAGNTGPRVLTVAA